MRNRATAAAANSVVGLRNPQISTRVGAAFGLLRVEFEDVGAGPDYEPAADERLALAGEEDRSVGGVAGIEPGLHERDGAGRGGGFQLGAVHRERGLSTLLVAISGLEVRVAVDAGFVGGHQLDDVA